MKDIISVKGYLCLITLLAFCSASLASDCQQCNKNNDHKQAKTYKRVKYYKRAKKHTKQVKKRPRRSREYCPCPCPDFTSYWTPYIGAEVHALHIRWPNSFGGNVLDDTYPEGGVFLGFKFCDYVAIEGGYEMTTSKVRQSSVPAGENVFGLPVATPPEYFYTKSQIKDWHADLLGFVPIYDPWCLELLGSVGVQRTKITNFSYIIANNNAPQNPYTSMAHFSASKTVMRAGIGIQQKWSECYGGRATIGWANTSKFHTLSSQETGLSKMQVKNSLRYGIGVFAEF